MQVINLEATISTPSLQVEMRTLRLGSGGGTTDYNDLSNKPKLEGVTLQGNVPISDLGLRTSDLINDSGFITTGDIPTKTSDLTNDSDFQTGAEVAASITAAIPTNVSYFTNDVGYITAAAIPTNVSAFTNDAGYLTSGDLPAFAVDSVNGQTGTVVLTGADIECGGSYHTNDAISTQIDAFTTDIANLTATMPTKTSDLQNDSGYITATGAPVQTVNGATGDVVLDGSDIEYSAGVTVNSKIDAVEASIPTVPVASVNGQTGAVVLDGDDIEYSTGVTVNNKIDSVEAAIPTDTATIENVSIASLNDGDYDVPVNELTVDIDANVSGYTEANIVNTPDNIAPLWSIDNAFRGVVNFNQLSPVYDISVAGGTAFTTGTTIVSDHKYFVSRKLGTNSNVTVGIFTKVNGTTTQCFSISGTMTATIVNSLNGGVSLGTTAQTDGNIWLYQNAAIRVYDLQIIDLTDMFGATIADYIYSLEQDNAGEGIAFFKSIYPNDYYVYDSGTNELVGSREGTTYNIPFGQSVTSGGTLNVTTGVLDITGGSTVTLTPTEVKTIIGFNNIYSDCGNVKKLTYYKLTPLGVYNWVKTQI